tara:strand:+ start:283 stop:1596 length:1314 start_codon:yes stop_codon:yes gene_type:complete
VLRFAPSPTGFIHVGNARIAILNYIFSKKNNLDFFLRIDDTDLDRSKEEFKKAIYNDLEWIGISYKFKVSQSSRLKLYNDIADKLKNKGLIYPCYETPDELNLKRKMLLRSGMPPIYDRSSLKLSDKEKANYEKEGRTPHWRFKLSAEKINWDDLIHDKITFDKLSISDPVVIRSDKTPLFTLTSVIDDAEFGVTHILRGDDHITNTAAQIQLFHQIGCKSIPIFGHLPLVKSINGESLSKRKDSLSLKNLRENGIQGISLFNMLSKIGTSNSLESIESKEKLIEGFSPQTLSKSSIYFDYNDLLRINSKYLSTLNFLEISRLIKANISEPEWETIKPNIKNLKDIQDWINILNTSFQIIEDKSNEKLIKESIILLPNDFSSKTWMKWCKRISKKTGIKGKKLYMTLRRKITGLESGPEMNMIISLLGRKEVLRRLQ